MPKRSQFDGESVDDPLRNAMVDAFNAALDENGDLGASLAIAFETGNAILRGRTSDMTLAEKVVATVAAQHGLEMMDMYATVRSRSISHPRFVAWWLIRKHTQMSFPAIGAMCRGVHHTAILKGCRHVGASAVLMAKAREIETLLFPVTKTGTLDGDHGRDT